MAGLHSYDSILTGFAKLAEVFGVSNDECVELLLTRFVFDSLETAGNEIIAEEVEQIVCENRSQAAAMAKRLEAFAGETRRNGRSRPPPCGTATDGRKSYRGLNGVLNRSRNGRNSISKERTEYGTPRK